MFDLSLERPEDGEAIEALLDRAFGTERFAKSSYDYRHAVERLWPLCLTARMDGQLVGTLRCWPISIGAATDAAVLVGPVAVDGALQGLGVGAMLVRNCLSTARSAGHALAVLVGDAGYYGRFGFVEAADFGIEMRRESPARVLTCPLDLAAPIPSGLVRPWRSVRGWRQAA